MPESRKPALLRDHTWLQRYRTSARHEDGRPVEIIPEFYVPALSCAVGYDRVAGYFRSSSLAAASQGFTALAKGGGKARLVVGADLDPADVAATLAGEDARLAGRLLPELEPGKDDGPLRHGLELLAWLVSRGDLELRVALRVHSRTGAPLALDSLADGYVHEKWGLVADRAGDRLYFTGSLNESRTALVLNAENLDLHCSWKSADALERVELAERDFERLWADREPALRVLPLPEAVRLRLLTIAEQVFCPREVDGASALPATVPPPSAEELQRFAEIREAPRRPGGEWVGMATAPVAPWPHQEIAARRLVESFPLSWLLCDEVGLGKTIEAGLAIRSLLLAGKAKRVLIAAPASLTQQWHRELESKFLLDFGLASGGRPRHLHLLGGAREAEAASIYAPDLVIASTGLLSRADRQAELKAAKPWDLVLVDEAHYARRSNPQGGVRGAPDYNNLYRSIEELRGKTRALWLATATPVQIDGIEGWDLMRLTRRVGSFGHDAATTFRFYGLLGRLAAGETLDDSDNELLRRAVAEVEKLDPSLWDWMRRAVVDGGSRVAVRQWLEQGRRPKGREDEKGVRRLIFAAAPQSRVMLRHTRDLLEEYRRQGELGARLARRKILPLQSITFSDGERRIYDALEDYCEGLAERLGSRLAANKARGAVQFYLSFLRLRFASSLFACKETLRRRLQRIEVTLDHLAPPGRERGIDSLEDLSDEAEDDTEAVDLLLKDRSEADLRWERDRLQALLSELADLSALPSKMTALLKALAGRRNGGRIRQTVVFTRFADTMEDILKHLRARDPNIPIGTYSGAGGRYTDGDTRELVPVPREEVKHRFRRGEIDVLLCTDAAAEGLNLQSADLLVNFDLPWNPVKVEQRIGRIDRIGQAHDEIQVLNLAYAGSAEEIVYGRLLQRLQGAELVVGTQQLAMLPVSHDDFAELAKRDVSPATVAEIETQARRRAAQQRERSRSMELPAAEQYASYRRLARADTPAAPPVDLARIWGALTGSAHLRALGCRLAGDDGEPWRVAGGDGEPCRLLLVDGIPGLLPAALTTDRELLERGIADPQRPLRFAAPGEPIFDAILAHVTSFAASDSTPRAAAEVPADTRSGLPCSRIEAANDLAGRSQAGLVAAVLAGLLEMEHQLGRSQEVFTREIKRLENLLANDRDRLWVKLKTDYARRLRCELFEFEPPRAATELQITAPRWLLLSALDLAWQEAVRTKQRPADLATADMIKRFNRDFERIAAEP